MLVRGRMDGRRQRLKPTRLLAMRTPPPGKGAERSRVAAGETTNLAAGTSRDGACTGREARKIRITPQGTKNKTKNALGS